MENTLNISEIFLGLQGEGQYCGVPALFIRLSGCTRACNWCDTKYHVQGKPYTFEELNTEIDKYLPEVIVWTGGEPLKQFKQLEEFILSRGKFFSSHHIETNGDLIASGEITMKALGIFDYICCSPKSSDVAKEVFRIFSDSRDLRMARDIKVVTDLIEIGNDMLEFATMLMPFTSGIPARDSSTKHRVWEYCVKNRLRYSPRLHVEVFGTGKRGV